MAEKAPSCPVCDNPLGKTGGNLFLCNSCEIAFNASYRKISYSDSYFLDDYRNQYGKTYFEDFNSIYSLSKKRLEKIISLMPSGTVPGRLKLMDIGSAAGFFLKCALDAGIQNLVGVEISDFVSDYCKREFGINVLKGPFDKQDPGLDFDIITAWLFIEHCENPMAVLLKIFNALNDGGVFAFSTVSIHGPLFRLRQDEWIQTHPVDHRIDFSPKGVRIALKKAGFRKIYIYPSGFHPERVMDKESPFFGLFSRVYRIYSKMAVYSDTIEVFAVK
ncbi:MAG: class I SAM-dependent methyltransferase [Spirochaetes bacterium]|jgi:SAM-dependent methyltransferase|nr:class I SAM-dependent methyltransferase [Spirochaetota bacterium]